MSRRREYSFVKPCAQPGCKEREFTVMDTQREYMEHVRYRTEHPFRCQRHRRPEEVIGVDQPRREITYVVIDDRGDKRWAGGRNTHSWLGGAGDDFQAYAEDFPLGTQLTITVALAAFSHTRRDTPADPGHTGGTE